MRSRAGGIDPRTCISSSLYVPGNGPIDANVLGPAYKSEATSELSAAQLKALTAAVEAGFTVPDDLPMHKGKTKLQSFGVILRRMRHQKMSSMLVPAGETVLRPPPKANPNPNPYRHSYVRLWGGSAQCVHRLIPRSAACVAYQLPRPPH